MIQKQAGNTFFKTGLLLPGLALLSLGACTPQSDHDQASSANPVTETREQSAAANGEVPAELLEKIIADLAASEKLDQESITVIRAESVIWPDGSLGCAKPGEMYTMAQVEGYWVVLQSGEQKFDYRAAASGQFSRCRNLFRVQNPVG